MKSVKGGKRFVILMFLLLAVAGFTRGQSVLTLGAGTSLGVFAGADLCVNIINTSGNIYGGGTMCGGVMVVEPLASGETPSSFELFQNYPNPFNPFTVIKYQMPRASYVSIKIYDELGKVAATVYEGNQHAGYFQATVDGSELASGIYFCKITAGDFSKVIKMSLIK
jgi:hypothetical protein